MKRILVLLIFMSCLVFGYSQDTVQSIQEIETIVQNALQNPDKVEKLADTAEITVTLIDTEAIDLTEYLDIGESIIDQPITDSEVENTRIPLFNMEIWISMICLFLSYIFFALSIYSFARVLINQYYQISCHTKLRLGTVPPESLSILSFSESLIWVFLGSICWIINEFIWYINC